MTERVYVSHGARLSTKGDVEWFVVEPQKGDPERLAAEVAALRRIGRTVVELEVEVRSGDRTRKVIPAPRVRGWWQRIGASVRHRLSR